MSVRSFHSVFMASAVAGAALGCYLVSLRVASERAALEQVENQIALAHRDIRLLQTEIGTRARLAQLERWNVRVLALSAPTADQILGDKFQLASLIQPQRRPAVEAPVVLASAPAPESPRVLERSGGDDTSSKPAELLHQASLNLSEPKPPKKSVRVLPQEIAEPKAATVKQPPSPTPRSAHAKASFPSSAPEKKKAGDKRTTTATAAVTRPVRTANVDPLAPLPADEAKAKGTRTAR